MTPLRPLDRSAVVGFSNYPLDRLSERREDDAFVAAKLGDPSTRFFMLAGDLPILKRSGDVYDPHFRRDEALGFGEFLQTIFLGLDEQGAALFGATIDRARAEGLAGRPDVEVVDLRSVAARGLVGPAALGEIGGAKAMIDWHARHRFCANCGQPSKVKAAGWRRECPACSAQHFPRVDPVVIMVAIDGDRCLLGRQARFAPGMYSALAGFLEPGETIEEAVRREIREEAGVACSRVVYLASQPWPFPSSLMIGCFAKATGTELMVDHTELEDARWFSRDELASMFDASHPRGLLAPLPFAIAHHLLKAFVEEGGAVLDD
jgi:NAD+ diphosphatase